MKILYLATFITESGGVAKIVADKVNIFVQRGIDVCIVSTNDSRAETFYRINDKVKFKFYDKKVNSFIQLKRYYQFVQKIVYEFNPDIILVTDNGIKAYFAPWFLKNRPIYFEVHGSRNNLVLSCQNKLKGWFILKITRFLSIKFDGMILLNPHMQKEWKHKQTIVIPNFIDIPKSENKIFEFNKKVIAIGRISSEKNYQQMLQIWEKVSIQQPDWTLEIYGAGKELYWNELNQNTSYSHVVWKGLASQEKLMEVIRQADFLIHTSHLEGMPMVFLEAMAFGKPVIAFDVDFGPADIIKNGENGFLIPKGNIQQFEKKVIKLMDNNELLQKMSRNAIQNTDRFCKEKIIAMWFSFFEEQSDFGEK